MKFNWSDNIYSMYNTYNIYAVYKLNKNVFYVFYRLIGNVLSAYDTDKKYPVWGFGGKGKAISNSNKHAFNVNIDSKEEEVDGIYGVEKCYIDSLKKVCLSQPTNFGSILKKAYKISKKAHDEYMKKTAKNKKPNPIQYNILLVLLYNIHVLLK